MSFNFETGAERPPKPPAFSVGRVMRLYSATRADCLSSPFFDGQFDGHIAGHTIKVNITRDGTLDMIPRDEVNLDDLIARGQKALTGDQPDAT